MEALETLSFVVGVSFGLFLLYHAIRYGYSLYQDIKTYSAINKPRFVSVNMSLADNIYLKKDEKYNLRRDENFLKSSSQPYLLKSMCSMVQDIIDKSSNCEFLVCEFEKNKDTITICKYKDSQSIYDQCIKIGRVYTLDEYNELISIETPEDKILKIINSVTINKN